MIAIVAFSFNFFPQFTSNLQDKQGGLAETGWATITCGRNVERFSSGAAPSGLTGRIDSLY